MLLILLWTWVVQHRGGDHFHFSFPHSGIWLGVQPLTLISFLLWVAQTGQFHPSSPPFSSLFQLTLVWTQHSMIPVFLGLFLWEDVVSFFLFVIPKLMFFFNIWEVRWVCNNFCIVCGWFISLFHWVPWPSLMRVTLLTPGESHLQLNPVHKSLGISPACCW